jgi:hypothetical protein
MVSFQVQEETFESEMEKEELGTRFNFKYLKGEVPIAKRCKVLTQKKIVNLNAECQ